MIIDFKCYVDDALKYPPIAAKELIPQWIKLLKPKKDGVGTVKKCPPIIDFLTSGYYLRSCYQYKFHRYITNNEEEIDISGKFTKDLPFDDKIMTIKTLGHHNFDQIPLTINNIKKSFWKFNQWWSFSTPPGYSCLIIPAFYHSEHFQIIPTILDTDSGFMVPQGLSAMSVYNNAEPKKWTVNCGDVIAHLIPFKREEWSSKIEDFDPRHQNYMIDKDLQNYKKDHRKKKIFK
jgi:hypothetical protein